MSDERSKNLHEQWYVIKFCVKLKKTVTEMKEMFDAIYNESAMLHINIYRLYNEFKSSRKGIDRQIWYTRYSVNNQHWRNHDSRKFPL